MYSVVESVAQMWMKVFVYRGGATGGAGGDRPPKGFKKI